MANPNPRGHRFTEDSAVDLGSIVCIWRAADRSRPDGITNIIHRGCSQPLEIPELTPAQHRDLVNAFEMYRSKR